ncbi:MAG: ribosome biogenesis GTPase Der [Phycisphaerae bacterium]|nr:ribosome biogenesis GTPase Der [Phycisphaerae bacterium]
MLPRIAIIGRPNVGKSSLFNRLAGRRISIVDPTPGVTRDRVSHTIEIPAPTDLEDGVGEPRYAELIDTGGYGVYTAEGKRFDDAGEDLSRLTGAIEAQIRAAADEADIILFVLDAHSGVTPLDQTIATMMRRNGHAPKVVVVANKVDDEGWESNAVEAAALGFGNPIMVSATSGYRKRSFFESIWKVIGERIPKESGPGRDAEMKLAIVGRRNAGKSSLINTLAGQPRVIVSEIAGTTRDAIDVRFEVEGKAMLAIDTAGVRKRKSWSDEIESFAHQRMLNAISRADVCVLLLDATEKSSQVEKRLAQELQDNHKPVVIAVNKWDLVDKKLKPADYLEYLEQEFPGLAFAPIVFLSAKSGSGVRDLIRMAFNLNRQADHREGTGRLNAVIKDILSDRGPSSKLGSKAKVFYVSQIDVRPPTIVMVVNKPDLFKGQYERYLLNQLREHLPFSEVPIRLVFSERKRISFSELASRRRTPEPEEE